MGINRIFMPFIGAALLLGTISGHAAPIPGPVTPVPVPAHVVGAERNAKSIDLLANVPHFSKMLPLPVPGDGRYFQFPPVILSCNLAFQATITGIGPGPTTFTSSGTGSFQTITSTTGPTRTTFQPVSFSASGSGPIVGTASWSLLTSTTPNSVITGNTLTADYPATGDLFLFVQGSFGATPGVTYISQSPIHLFTPILNTFNPQVNETWALASPVGFADSRTPSLTAFTITSGSATFN